MDDSQIALLFINANKRSERQFALNLFKQLGYSKNKVKRLIFAEFKKDVLEQRRILDSSDTYWTHGYNGKRLAPTYPANNQFKHSLFVKYRHLIDFQVNFRCEVRLILKSAKFHKIYYQF